MRFRPFLAAHEGIHARIADLTSSGNLDRLVWHPLSLQGGRSGLLRHMTFTTVNLTFRTRMLVASVLLLQERAQITAMDKVLFGSGNTLQAFPPDPPKNSIRGNAVQLRDFIYRIGIVFPDEPQIIDELPGHALSPAGGDQGLDFFNTPGCYFGAELNRFRISTFFHTDPPVRLTDRIEFQNVGKSDKSSIWESIISHNNSLSLE